MRKLSLILTTLFLMSVLIVTSFAYILNPQDKVLIDTLTKKVEAIILKKGEKIREPLVKSIKNLVDTYKNQPRMYAILNQVTENIDSSFTSDLGNIAGTYNRTLIIDEKKREFIVYIPESAAGRQRVPVVFFIHGTGGNGQAYNENPNLWRRKANEKGFIAVYPTALVHCHYENGVKKNITKWADGKLGEKNITKGGLPLCHGQDLADDMKFFDEMITVLKNDYIIDSKRIYASGFSNGASMAYRLAAQRSDIFAAVAAHANFLSNFIPQNPASRPISIIITFGGSDSLFANALGIKLPIPINENLMKNSIINNALGLFLKIHGLSNTFVYSESQYKKTMLGEFLFHENTTSSTNYIRFVMIKGLDHDYVPALVDAYWDFFEGESLP